MKRGVLQISEALLKYKLGLREDVDIVSINFDPFIGRAEILVHSDDMEETIACGRPPIITASSVCDCSFRKRSSSIVEND